MVVSSSDRDVAAVNVAQPPSSPAPVQQITPFPSTSVPQKSCYCNECPLKVSVVMNPSAVYLQRDILTSKQTPNKDRIDKA